MKKPSFGLVFLALGLFLAPIIGGKLSVDAQPLAPGQFMQALMGGSELPLLTHALLACLVFLAMAWGLIVYRVIQVPHVKLSIALAVLIALLGLSVFRSSFILVSLQTWLEWLAYAAAFYAAIALSGRHTGPRILAGAIAGGCSIVALKGLAEYGQMRALDPTWRIYGDWVNPNALSGMLLLGLFVALGLMLASKRTIAFAWGAAATAIGFALLLTQSKGGYLSAAFGIFGMLALSSFSLGLKSSLRLLIPTGIVFCLALALRYAPTGSAVPASGALGRLGQAKQTQEQSVGFRKLLWTSAFTLAKQEPFGIGGGTFRYNSARPGLTTQTHLAHNTYLQLGAEAGIAAFIAFVAFVILWLRKMLRATPHAPPEQIALRLGILAAAAAFLAHNVIDSDLYHFGMGVCFFALLGVGLQLASDGSTPELMPRSLRWSGAISFCILPVFALFAFGLLEKYKARAEHEMAASNLSLAQEELERALSLAPWDGESWYLTALAEPDPTKRLEALQKAVRFSPTLRYHRALAREWNARGNASSALLAYQAALSLDSNNLPALIQILELYLKEGSILEAKRTLDRMIQVETKPYFKIRSIPEIVPTETYRARLLMAPHAKNFTQKAEWLDQAVQGYLRYARITLPKVVQGERNFGGSPYPGETYKDAQQKMQDARDAAKMLAETYLALGVESKALSAEELSREFVVEDVKPGDAFSSNK